MSSTIQQGLLITVIGMGLVFAVIIFLWWIMGLLVRVTSKEDTIATGQDEGFIVDVQQVPDKIEMEPRRRAAAAAVAVAIAQSQARHLGGKGKEIGTMSPWQSVHRARQLEQHNTRG